LRVLIAGVGNVLKCDDGFGVRAAAVLKAHAALPSDITVIETGIGGMHLVQELMRGYDAVFLFDAFDRGGTPGQVFLLEPQLPNHDSLSERERRDFFADTHYATPLRALTLAREIGALPPLVRIIGCQPIDAESFGVPMNAAVAEAIGPAIELALSTIASLRRERCKP
jgi:hydrogenase maturation protease